LVGDLVQEHEEDTRVTEPVLVVLSLNSEGSGNLGRQPRVLYRTATRTSSGDDSKEFTSTL
jgi:hypothetical protein